MLRAQLLDGLGRSSLHTHGNTKLLHRSNRTGSRLPIDGVCSARTEFVKLGLIIGYWNNAGPPAGVRESIAEAEKLGFDSMWTAEAYGSDAFTPLAWWGSETSRIKLGTSVAQISARTPAATAMSAITLDHLSGGRLLLGLARRAHKSSKVGTASRIRSRWHARVSTSRSCGASSAARRSTSRASTTRCRTEGGVASGSR